MKNVSDSPCILCEVNLKKDEKMNIINRSFSLCNEHFDMILKASVAQKKKATTTAKIEE